MFPVHRTPLGVAGLSLEPETFWGSQLLYGLQGYSVPVRVTTLQLLIYVYQPGLAYQLMHGVAVTIHSCPAPW